MNSAQVLLQRLLTDDQVNSLIEKCQSVDELNQLLSLKVQISGTPEPELAEYVMPCILDSIERMEPDLMLEIFTNARRLVTEDQFFLHLKEFLNHSLSNISTESQVRFLFVLLTICDRDNSLGLILRDASKRLVEHFLKNDVTNKTLFYTKFIPTYLIKCNSNIDNEVLVESIIKSKNYDFLCGCILSLLKLDNLIEFLIEKINFILFLQEGLTSRSNTIVKQSLFLLSTLIQCCKERKYYPKILSPREGPSFECVWSDYFLLFNVAQEKQLHLILPLLSLINFVNYLNIDWQICIFSILLNHSQNSVVFKTATNILAMDTWFTTNRGEVTKLFPIILHCVNKNEYNRESLKMLESFESFVAKLDCKEFNNLIETLLEIQWCPTGFWCAFSRIFPENSIKNVPETLLQKLDILIRKLNNVFIRNNILLLLHSIIKKQPISLEICLMLDKYSIQHNIHFNSTLKSHLLKFIHSKKPSYEKISALLQVPLSFSLDIENIEDINILVLIYSRQSDLFDKEEIFNFIINTLGEPIDSFVEPHYLNIIENLATDKKRQVYEKTIPLLDKHYVNIPLVLKMLRKTNTGNCNELLTSKLQELCLQSNDDDIWRESLLLGKPQSVSETLKILQSIATERSNSVIEAAITYAEPFMDNLDVLKACLTNLLYLKGSVYFSPALNTILSHLKTAELLEMLLTKLKSLHYLSYVNDILNHIIFNDIKISHSDALLNDFLSFLLIVNAVRKEDRINYNISLEIYSRIEHLDKTYHSKEKCPGYKETNVRHFLFSVLSLRFPSEKLLPAILNKYNTLFNRPYFPNSQTHLQKLRILQLLVTIIVNENFTFHETTLLFDFCIKNLKTEANQPCIKLLLQFLLNNCVSYQSDLASKIYEHLDENLPNAFVNLIPAIITFRDGTNPTNWTILLKASMGANFKLRFYAQFAIVKLGDKFDQINLHSVAKDVLVRSNAALYGQLEEEQKLLSDDEDSLENSVLERAYLKIPQYHKVTPLEWAHIGSIYFGEKLKPTFALDDAESSCQSLLADYQNFQRKIDVPMEAYNVPNTKLILITSLIEKPANLGGLSRTCEVYGIKRMVVDSKLVGTTKEFLSLSMSSENWVALEEVKVKNLPEFLTCLKQEGYHLIGAEQTVNSTPLHQFKFVKKTALLLGNEKEGIRPDLIQLLDGCVEIPQMGVTRSLNVHVAGAIILWEYAKQCLSFL